MRRRLLVATSIVAGCTPSWTDLPCVDGQAGPFPCDGVDLLSFVPAPAFDAKSASDLWGWTDPVDGREIVLLGLDNGVGLVDVTDPYAPEILGHLRPPGSFSFWRDIKTYADHLYAVSEGSSTGLQVFDLRTLPHEPGGRLPSVEVGGFWSAHNLSIDEVSGRAYLSGASCDGLQVYDLEDPGAPSYDGCLEVGYVHDAQCLTWDAGDPEFLGRELCFAASPDARGLMIVDVTERHLPTIVSETEYPEHRLAHQGWLTEDRRYFLMGDELDEWGDHDARTYVFDVQDLDAVTYVGAHEHDGKATDHNLYVVDGRVYLAHYNDGLRVLRPVDLSRAELEQVAWFDTAPDRDGPTADGAWSSYPWFESGTVAVSTSTGVFAGSGVDRRREGLFLLRVWEQR